MQKGDMLHGFWVLGSQDLPEIGAVMWRMEYEKNGARLIWLDRPDDNKTFSIAFKTIPQDDTGVFHILEHSVLNGSEKYPVKEPFVELLKSSMATFLNAMTFPDKTMYPVSSRNAQDFLNLIDVYMDAVLHPLSLHDPHAFRQEGWHYELDSPEGELRFNGVVYNEMKGAYGSADRVMEAALDRLLFPDSCYGYESGGHPDHIPELTYEEYLANHARFYHPSNSYICLDGQMDLDAVLAKLDGFLAPYERIDPDADIPMQAPVAPPEQTCYYEIGAEEDERNKAILAGGWVFGTYDDIEPDVAFSVLSQYLCGSNEAPLTKALLDEKLAEDVVLDKMDGVQQLYAVLEIKNADPAQKDHIWQTVEGTLSALADNGLDKKRLHSILDRLEFTIREKDFGTTPRGLVYAISSLETWLYGGDPALNFSYSALFASLREKIDAGWFEGFLRRVLLDNGHRARVLMLPSKTLGQAKARAEADRCAAIKARWDDAAIQAVMEEFRVLRERQSRVDTPEELASLPTLKLSDIPEEGMPFRQEVGAIEGVTVLRHPVETDGITYLDLYFDVSDLPLETLQKAKLLTRLLGQAATEHYNVLALRSAIEGTLGRFSAAVTVFGPAADTGHATPYVQVSISMLPDHKADAAALLGEILNTTRFDDGGFIYNILRQERLGLEQSITMSGNSYGSMRVAAQGSARGAVSEAVQGLSMLRAYQAWDKAFQTEGGTLCREMADLCGKLFTRERLTVSLTGPRDDGFVSSALAVLNSGGMGEKAAYSPLPTRREGFVIPAQVGFAARGANLYGLGSAFTGADLVAGQLLTLDYLWNRVRVKGGAYGVNLSVRVLGDVAFTSYRDPSPAATLDTFAQASQALREAAAGPIDKYIISTISSTEPVLSPWMEGLRAAGVYLNGQSGADLARQRREILRTTPEQLTAFADILDAVCAAGRICVIGGQAVLDACRELDTVEPVQQ